MPAVHLEKGLEDTICEHLAAHGWHYSPDDTGYDRELALFPDDLFAWLEATQPDQLARIVPPEGTDAQQNTGRDRILNRLAKTLQEDPTKGGGTLGVLRNGLDVVGARRFRTIQVPPQDGLNDTTIADYAANRLRVMRQVHYSKTDRKKSLDLVFFCNGIPVATIELKSDFTQSLDDAKRQYCRDRLPQGEPLLTWSRGALVHFIVSDTLAAMTTKLAGDKTFFLPFNQGKSTGTSNGIGANVGAGNPTTGTKYLWEETWQRDNWLTILTKFVYLKTEDKEDPNTGRVSRHAAIRFPRYHQWRAVTNLTRTAREEGPGHNYLIQHSAGSGKTDSIAWTAHRLASLHREDGTKVFDGVIVIADRQVLDKQLQAAVDQLVVHAGTFTAITRSGESTSKTEQLTEALLSGKPIIGVTLQTFPHALEAMLERKGGLGKKTYAVIADEAHSSQSGDATAKLRVLLSTSSKEELDQLTDEEDALRIMAAKANDAGRLSFFAFTATPKEKTLQLFGRRSDDGPPQAFDLYSMKQAIEEGFILDVLQNYTTYDMAARIARTAGNGTTEELDIDKAVGHKALVKYVRLSATNVGQKVDVIIEHFTNVVAPHLGGQAKAMIVTDSRQAAATYKQQFDQIAKSSGSKLRALVAFSGEVTDPKHEGLDIAPKLTETSMNPMLRGRSIERVFATDEAHVLIVANKYQTGFDQPLLVAMYVDKKLSGITAVQTLSRLNRSHPGKKDTFILDFVNEPSVIEEAFQTYYTDARVETESDPDLVLTLLRAIEQSPYILPREVDATWTALRRKTAEAREKVKAHVLPAADRFHNAQSQAEESANQANINEVEEFRQVVSQYPRMYGYFSQFVNYGDERYEKYAIYLDLLARLIRKEGPRETMSTDDIVLTHYRLTKRRDENLSLGTDGDQPGLQGPTEAGLAAQRERERGTKDEIIERTNEFFDGSNLTDADKVSVIEAIMNVVVTNKKLQIEAANNPEEAFRHSPTLHEAVGDAPWTAEENLGEGFKYVRDQNVNKLVKIFFDLDIYKKLREQGKNTKAM